MWRVHWNLKIQNWILRHYCHAAELQKAMDYTLIGLQDTYCFLDDIIIFSNGTETDHLAYVAKCLKKLDEDNLRINLRKCHFAKSEIE